MVAHQRRRRRRRVSIRRKRVLDSSMVIDYKKPDVLKKFITERGKIIPSRVSGATHSQQLAITKAVKRARYLALIPISVAHEKEKGFVGEMSEIAQTFTAASMRYRPFVRGGNHPSRGDVARGDVDTADTENRESSFEQDSQSDDTKSPVLQETLQDAMEEQAQNNT